jgi:AcrR family transcriptional regulator
MRKKGDADRDLLVEQCLEVFVAVGMLDASLDQLAQRTGTSKRMLIHYFGSRENLEELAMSRLEERLRARFLVEAFPLGTTALAAVIALWEQTTAPESRGILQLVMDLSRRGWSGSARGKVFYEEQQRSWGDLLANFLPDAGAVEELLQLFQGAVLAFLVTGDPKPGMRALERMVRRNT